MKVKLSTWSFPVAILGVSIGIATPTFANPWGGIPDPSTCVCSNQDPYDPKPRMPMGLFQGQCLNSCQQRSIMLIPLQSDERLRQYPGGIAIANVSHQGKFWLASIPSDGVAEVIYQMEQIANSCPLCHSQLRFRFKETSPVILLPQIQDQQTSPLEITELVYSVEATGVPGVEFNPLRALFDIYAISYRMVSLEDRYQRMVVQDGHRVEQLRLALTAEERRRLLENALRQSDEAGMTRMYNLFSTNCTTELFSIIDASVNKTGKSQYPNPNEAFFTIPTGTFISILLQEAKVDVDDILKMSELPEVKQLLSVLRQSKHPRDALEERGLLDRNSAIPDLNQERP